MKKGFFFGIRVSGRSTALVIVLLVFFILVVFQALAEERISEEKQDEQARAKAVWAELLARQPYPFALPLPPTRTTPIDGTYTKVETREGETVRCRRCPDYLPEGGIWKLSLEKGIFRIFHPFTGWKSMGSYFVSGEQLLLANDPVCQEVFGLYTWKREKGKLILEVIEDPCGIRLRAMNITHRPWSSCLPPNREAGITGHWPIPPGCE